MNLLHTFVPPSIALTFGPISIYWYGILVVVGISLGTLVTVWLGKKNQINQEIIFDLSFYLIIFSIIGARLYDVLLELPYYIKYPTQIPAIWNGGLAIHGAILAGAITIYSFSKKNKLSLIRLTSIIVPGLALGQAIGRWGNYFNQELFGLPTNSSWGIFISPIFRPENYINYEYFHPTFLYESFGCLVIFIILIFLHQKITNDKKHLIIIATYLISYSLLRFGLEFIRIDYAPTFLGLRWPQIISLLIIMITIIVLYSKKAPTLAKM